jgi:hypothetical protein
MSQLPFQHAVFIFTPLGEPKHELTVTVTPCIDLEWQLYINGVEAGYILNTGYNILLPTDANRALSFSNVTRVYNQLLSEAKKPLP